MGGQRADGRVLGVHPRRRGVRPHRPARRLHARRGVPQPCPLAPHRPRRRAALRVGQPLTAAGARERHRRHRRRGVVAPRSARHCAVARDHRERDDGGLDLDRRRDGRSAFARCSSVRRRLRHRVLVAVDAQAIPRVGRQDRPLVRVRTRPPSIRLVAGGRDRRHGVGARNGGDRRGRRDARSGIATARARLHRGPGLPVRDGGAVRRGDTDAHPSRRCRARGRRAPACPDAATCVATPRAVRPARPSGRLDGRGSVPGAPPRTTSGGRAPAPPNGGSCRRCVGPASPHRTPRD